MSNLENIYMKSDWMDTANTMQCGHICWGSMWIVGSNFNNTILLWVYYFLSSWFLEINKNKEHLHSTCGRTNNKLQIYLDEFGGLCNQILMGLRMFNSASLSSRMLFAPVTVCEVFSSLSKAVHSEMKCTWIMSSRMHKNIYHTMRLKFILYWEQIHH